MSSGVFAAIVLVLVLVLVPRGALSDDDGGPSDRVLIQKVIGENLKEIRGCYEKLLPENPELEGKLVLSWSVGAGGKVTKATVKENKLRGYAAPQLVAFHFLGIFSPDRTPRTTV